MYCGSFAFCQRNVLEIGSKTGAVHLVFGCNGVDRATQQHADCKGNQPEAAHHAAISDYGPKNSPCGNVVCNYMGSMQLKYRRYGAAPSAQINVDGSAADDRVLSASQSETFGFQHKAKVN